MMASKPMSESNIDPNIDHSGALGRNDVSKTWSKPISIAAFAIMGCSSEHALTIPDMRDFSSSPTKMHELFSGPLGNGIGHDSCRGSLGFTSLDTRSKMDVSYLLESNETVAHDTDDEVHGSDLPYSVRELTQNMRSK